MGWEYVYFIHVPRTAGTYLTRFLERELSGQFVREGHTVPSCALRPWTERFGPAHYTSVPREKCLTVSIVRNPFDLLVSMYVWGFPYWPPKNYAGARQINWPFWSFRDYVEKLTDSDGYPWLVPEQRVSLFFQLFGETGHVLPDVVLRQECLAEGIPYLGKLLGKDWSAPTAPVNATGRAATADFYDASLVRRVETCFAGDLACFGYGFGQHDNRPVVDTMGLRCEISGDGYANSPSMSSSGASPSGDLADTDLHDPQLVPLASGRRLVSEVALRVGRRIGIC